MCAAGLLLLALLLPAPLFAGNTVPDWMRAAMAQPVPGMPATTKAVVLLEEETYTVAPDGRAIEHVRKVVKILRPQGPRSSGTRCVLRQGLQGAFHACLEHRSGGA